MSDDPESRELIGSQFSRAVPGCPVTRGLPTRMTRAGFERLCERHRDQPDGYCKEVCRGTLPPAELEFIEIEGQQEENMGKIKYEHGLCQMCGRKANLRKCLGKEVCSGCDFVWRTINGKHEQVFAALLEKMGATWVHEAMPGGWVQPALDAEPSPVDQGELAPLRETLAELQASYAELVEMNSGQRQELESLTLQRDELADRLGRLYEMNADREAGVPVALKPQADPNRDTVLLDLALGLLDGTITGVSTVALKILRQ